MTELQKPIVLEIVGNDDQMHLVPLTSILGITRRSNGAINVTLAGGNTIITGANYRRLREQVVEAGATIVEI